MIPDSPHERSDYIGKAVIVIRGTEVPVEVELRGYPEPIDGIFRWIGRISPNPQLSEILSNQDRVKALVRIDGSEKEAVIGDPDPWNRYRIIGKSTPPFQVATATSTPVPTD